MYFIKLILKREEKLVKKIDNIILGYKREKKNRK